jgi:hypothetical protein
MASWTMLEEQRVWIAPRVTAFTVVCLACSEQSARDGYGGAAVSGWLPLDALRGTIECPHGHRLRIEREGR